MKHAITASVLLLTAPLSAQNLSGEFTPNVVQVGTPVTFTITDATGQGLNLPSSCTWYGIFQGAQNGPRLSLPGFCLAVLVPVAPGGSASYTWNQQDTGGQVPAGQYWFRATAWDSGINRQFTDWFCLSILNPGEPAYTVQNPPQLGTTANFSIAAPQDPGAIYLSALSFSSNNPVSAGGLQSCLSLPIVTGLTNGLGALDGQGNVSGIALPIPNIPALHNLGLHSQALLLTTGGLLRLSNDVSMTLR